MLLMDNIKQYGQGKLKRKHVENTRRSQISECWDEMEESSFT